MKEINAVKSQSSESVIFEHTHEDLITHSTRTRRTSCCATTSSLPTPWTNATSPLSRISEASSVVSLPDYGDKIDGTKSRYTVLKRFADGTNPVFLVTSDNNKIEYALKMFLYEKEGFNLELKVLNEGSSRNQCGKHFCKVVDYGEQIVDEKVFPFIVMSLVGRNLDDLSSAKVLSDAKKIRYAKETLKAIHDLHSLGFIHRDLKLDNFAIGKNDSDSIVYILDFETCEAIKFEDIPDEALNEEKPFECNIACASIAYHEGKKLSFKDDLESWFYMICKIFHTDEFDSRNLLKSKLAILEDVTIKDKIPSKLLEIYGYIRSLKYKEIPNYEYILNQLDSLLKEKAIENGKNNNNKKTKKNKKTKQQTCKLQHSNDDKK